LLYAEAGRMLAADLPVIAAVQGGAIGGGLGLALSADFRIASSQSRFAANFVAMGLHPGFGITLTLPQVVGKQAAADLILTGRRVDGATALALGLCDRLSEAGSERAVAIEFAEVIAAAAPLAVREVRRTLRAAFLAEFAGVTAVEFAAQSRLFGTDDFAEGVKASAERRTPDFRGR
jgi:2-(1,2-epoxy-1,2-dihydrophenyl)acetyl-CoA isomerase